MGSKHDSLLASALVRDATSEDAPALASIRRSEILHLDRIRSADGEALRYLVVETDGEIVGVDPENNARALSLYRRPGYTSIDPKPVEDRWEYVDSNGVQHAGAELIIHMKKALA